MHYFTHDICDIIYTNERRVLFLRQSLWMRSFFPISDGFACSRRCLDVKATRRIGYNSWVPLHSEGRKELKQNTCSQFLKQRSFCRYVSEDPQDESTATSGLIMILITQALTDSDFTLDNGARLLLDVQNIYA
ncbi:hypothetical protein OIU85_005655 [Salix viminalis]|uniref:Uncharacterized protein n=1 Tax=Salix viminalis TaxID=40686 RepID=A0A9Q0PJ94_SALVM|nr:hypothetical protein OIU85_005655 [Salix viminalis]